MGCLVGVLAGLWGLVGVLWGAWDVPGVVFVCLWGVLVCLWGVLRVRLGCLGEVFGGLWSLEGVFGEHGRVKNTVYYVYERVWGSLARLVGIFSLKSLAAVFGFRAFS